MKKIAFAALVPLMLAACATVAGPTGTDRYTGLYSWGFEVSGFQPCGASAAWWVTGGDSIQTRYDAVATRDYEAVYVVLDGRVGPEGVYGHLGAYTRELEVAKVVEMRPARPGECTAG